MFDIITKDFKKHTLLNNPRSRRDFYTAGMKPGEKMLSYIDRVQQLGSAIKSISVKTYSNKLAVALLNDLPSEYEIIIWTLDALCKDSEFTTLEVIKILLFQKEKRRSLRKSDSSKTALTDSSMKPSREGQFWPSLSYSYCTHRSHTEERSWDKQPSLQPTRISSRCNNNQKEAFLVDTASQETPEKEYLVYRYVKGYVERLYHGTN